MKKKSYDEAVIQFSEQGRDDLILLEEGYVCWRKKAIFFDKVIGKTFEAIPKSVFYQKSCHPERAAQMRKETNLKKYGNPSSLHGDTKAAKEVREKKIRTWRNKYGEQHFSKSNEVKEKVKRTNQERYGVSNPGELKKLKVAETGKFIDEWFKEQPEPKPCSYQSFGVIYLFGKGQAEFKENELCDFLKEYRTHKTKLEILGEKVPLQSKASPQDKIPSRFQNHRQNVCQCRWLVLAFHQSKR